MAIAIGSPADSNPRDPNVSVVRIRKPGAVVVEVLVADDIG
jgi:hypothetical protein